MKYEKPPLGVEAQADLLLSRGMIADKAELVKRLAALERRGGGMTSVVATLRSAGAHPPPMTTDGRRGE